MNSKNNSKAWIIAAGPIDNIEFYNTIKPQPNDIVIAADGGYDNAVKIAITPDVVIGDLDSCTGNINENIKILKYNPDKDKTDLHLAVDYAIDNGYLDICLLFAFGGRIDHSIANIITLRYILQRGGYGIILCDGSTVALLNENTNKGIFPKTNYKRISLIPLTTTVSGVTTNGLLYKLHNHTLYQINNLGISNQFTQNTATVSIKQGNLLIICENKT